MVKRFEDLRVWQEARRLSVMVYRATREKSWKDRALGTQIQRAASSTMSNISEGFVRLHPRELRQGFNICIGSANEVQNHAYLALDLGYLSETSFQAIYDQCTLVLRMSKSFLSHSPSQHDD